MRKMQIKCKGCYESYDSKYEICPHCGYYEGAAPHEPFQLPVGTELMDRYVLGLAIGLGGFGITYKAWDKTLETTVAVKEYYPSGLVNRIPGNSEVILFSGIKRKEFEFGLERFIQEAQNMAKFSTHDNIVNVFTFFEENNTAYIVMEYLDGCTLSEEVKEHGMCSIERSVDIILSVCDALKDIHATGIIHRDISPDNIFLCKNGTIKLIDFGAARFSQNAETNYTIILKPGFAPPEQYEQISKQGPWTDIYAVGATLYYLMTGQKPDESTNRKVKDTLKAPREVNPDVPAYLSDAIVKAMAIESNLRFKSIDEFRLVLKKEKKVRSLKAEKRMRRTVRFVGIAMLLLIFAFISRYFIKKMDTEIDKTKLMPAELTVWYTDADNLSMANAYEQIIQDFCAGYPDVQVHWEIVSEQTPLSELLTKPGLFLSSGTSNEELPNDLLDLSPCVEEEEPDGLWEKLFGKESINCLFLDEYNTYFPDHSRIPIGFVSPMLFVNTSLCPFEADSISSIDEILKHTDGQHVLLVNGTMRQQFEQIFPGADSMNIVFGTPDTFLQGKAAFYFGGSDEFFSVRTMGVAGIPKVIEIKAEQLPCTLDQMWSVIPGSEEQNAASIRFLQYMIGEEAQTKLFCRADSEHALPINQDALKAIGDLYNSLDYLNSKSNQWTVMPNTDIY